MGEALTYFFDTYAFFEIACGNEAYNPYVENAVSVTSEFNLYELHYNLLRRYGEKIANEYYDIFAEYRTAVSPEDIKAASAFRLERKRDDISYADALGYVIARRRGMKFLTGDKAFKNLPGVEFVQ